jgi:hypothetical protein
VGIVVDALFDELPDVLIASLVVLLGKGCFRECDCFAAALSEM